MGFGRRFDGGRGDRAMDGARRSVLDQCAMMIRQPLERSRGGFVADRNL